MSEELKAIREKLEDHDVILFGDPRNMKASPGLFNEQQRMSSEQVRTNEILTELRNSVIWLTRTVVGGIITSVVGGIIALFLRAG